MIVFGTCNHDVIRTGNDHKRCQITMNVLPLFNRVHSSLCENRRKCRRHYFLSNMDATFTALEVEFGGTGGNIGEKLVVVNAEIERALNRLTSLQSYASYLKSAMNRMQSPIIAFPDEIMSQIFYWTSLEADTSTNHRTLTRPNIPNLVAAASVCRRWRSICHSSPVLWRHFDWTLQGLRRDEYDLCNYVEPCLQLSSPFSIDLRVSFTMGVTWDPDLFLSFIGRYASKFSHLTLTTSFQRSLLKHPMSNLRSLNIQTVPFLFTSLPSVISHFPVLAALEIFILHSYFDDHAWDAEISDAVARYDPCFKSTCPIQQLTVSHMTDSMASVLMRPICHTLVHLYLGPIAPPTMELDFRSDRLEVLQHAATLDISLPCLQTLDIDIDIPRWDSHPHRSLYERLQCGSLRRVRCRTSRIGSPNQRDAKEVWKSRKSIIDVQLWAIRCLTPHSTVKNHPAPRTPPAERPYLSSTPRLLILENKHFPQSIATVISSVAQSCHEDLVFVSCRGQAVTSQPHNSKSRALHPALDLDMNSGSVLPSPEDPFWEDNIEAIIRLRGQPSGTHSGAGKGGRIPERLLSQYGIGDLDDYFKGNN